MKVKKIFFIVFIFIFPWIFSATLTISAPTEFSNHPFPTLSTSSGVSNYTINNYVTYDIETNFSVQQTSGNNVNYYFKYARLNDRQPNNTLTRFTPPYQESELLYLDISGYDTILSNHNDRFNNTYDSFNRTITGSGSITYSSKYRVTLNDISISGISDSDIGPYDTSDPIFILYCNNTEPFYNTSDPLLISLSNSLVDFGDNPIEKAQKVYNWVSSNINYQTQSVERGASWAYKNLRGDCSEYSSLMITLLRIQKIPARKVTGDCISASLNFKPKKGNSWTFDLHATAGSPFSGTNPPLGHAWMEYYVPNIGWIACDPTWGASGANYFNHIDYQHLTHNIGAYFFYPPSYNFSEFSNPTLYYEYWMPTPNFQFDYEVKVKVLDTNLKTLETLTLITTIIIIAAIIIALVAIVLTMTIKRKRKKEVTYYEY